MPLSNTEPIDIETVIGIGIDTKYNLVLFVFFNPWELIVWWGTIAFLFRGEIRPFLFTGALGLFLVAVKFPFVWVDLDLVSQGNGKRCLLYLRIYDTIQFQSFYKFCLHL